VIGNHYSRIMTDYCPVYFNDSVAMKVFAYDFDLESGSISNRRLFIDRRSTYGEPDGMVVE
jgi:sugar lactone lactonase YvrE